LIGSQLHRFHSDFPPIKGKSSRSIWLGFGKKTYLDTLTHEEVDIDYHVKIKDIPPQIILNHFKRFSITFPELYQKLYY
jgi:hypothetical protein